MVGFFVLGGRNNNGREREFSAYVWPSVFSWYFPINFIKINIIINTQLISSLTVPFSR